MTLRPFIAALVLAAVAGAGAAHAHSFKAGDIDIEHPYARASAPGQPNGGAYLQLKNAGRADRLLSASAAVSTSIELHSMQMEGDVMRMRQVDAIDVPTGQAVVLQPGGLHLMLVGLKQPLLAGARFPLTLKFEKAGEVKVEVVVEAVKDVPMQHDMKH